MMPPKNAIEDFMTGADEAPVMAAEAPAEAAVEGEVSLDLSDADYRYLTLRRAIKRGGEKIARIRMRPAMLEDIDDWSNAEISNRELLARLCDLPPEVLKKLAWDDAEALMEIFHQVVPEFVFAAAKDDA
ncbi:MAG: phage tail assembly protein [Mesorhizobium sp.]|uniref:phage tail assembly protein n=2 Tax=unclassified Mesorhizobium TaxID=325217 RepID=UPI000FCC7D98|nr:phage tail assembly protein [Mesorhizobium sp. M1A.F.Ca.IN.022.04.1.1]RUV13092.1 phage tail assembly protein [Mesorhizobium sp. M1A.F.Ca.IN.022.04.1.1]RWG26829.1 MAG: phage tail assembly protein [Mesorhizobium sp.]WIE90790.1 phage tail assembly protein [Mesorhizobium sp. WSM4875]